MFKRNRKHKQKRKVLFGMCLDFDSETRAQKALKVQKKTIFSNKLLAGERKA